MLTDYFKALMPFYAELAFAWASGFGRPSRQLPVTDMDLRLAWRDYPDNFLACGDCSGVVARRAAWLALRHRKIPASAAGDVRGSTPEVSTAPCKMVAISVCRRRPVELSAPSPA